MRTMLPKIAVDGLAPIPVSAIAAEIARRASASGIERSLILVDGTGGSGKSSFAKALVAALNAEMPDEAALVAVDDISWWLHPINWEPQMLDGVINPWLAGRDVDYRPPGWVDKGREGSVKARSNRFLVVEGVTASRQSLAKLATVTIWVNTDPEVAFKRMVDRDIELGLNGDTRAEVEQFAQDFMADEIPFQLTEQPWLRANLIVDCTHPMPKGQAQALWQNTQGLVG